MEIEFKGANCVVITHKKNTYVTDPKLSEVGLKDQAATADVQLLTQARFEAPHTGEALIINGPGEYEVQNCSVKGIAAQSHMETSDGPKTATMYRLTTEDLNVAIIGHIFPQLNNEQLEALGVVDVLIIPVGDHGYTLDAKGAVDVIRAVEPKIVIPTHYAEDGVTYEVPQAPLDEFLKELGTATHETTAKLKLKAGQLPETLTVYQLQRTK